MEILELQNLNLINGQIETLHTCNSMLYVGTSDDGIKFQPQQLQNFRVEGEVLIDLVNVVPIVWTYEDPTENNSRPSFLQPKKSGTPTIWNIKKTLKDPKAILSTVTTPVLTGFDIVLVGYDDVPLEGASKEDVVIEDTTTGVLTAVTTLTESVTVPGTYVALATIAAGTYYIGMAPVGTASATQGTAGLRSDLIKEEHIVS